MEAVIGWLWSKIGLALGGAVALLALWLRGSYHKRRAERARVRARIAEAQADIQKVETEYAPKISRMEEAGRTGDAGAVADSINRVWGKGDGQ